MKSKIIAVKLRVSTQNNYIKKVDDQRYSFRIDVTEPPVQNKANRKMIELMSAYLGLDKKKLSILSGEDSEIKLLEIHE